MAVRYSMLRVLARAPFGLLLESILCFTSHRSSGGLAVTPISRHVPAESDAVLARDRLHRQSCRRLDGCEYALWTHFEVKYVHFEVTARFACLTNLHFKHIITRMKEY